MPIVIHMPFFHGGGAEAVMVKLANHWASNGVDVTLLVNADEGAMRERVSPEVPVVALGDRRTSRSFPRLVRYLSETRPPVIVSALISANIAAAAAIRLAGVQTAHVALARNFISREIAEEAPVRRLLAAPALRWALRSATQVGCVCSAVREDVIAWAGLDPERVSVTYNPIEPVDATTLPRPAEYAGEGSIVVAVGRLSEQKNYPLLLDAAAKARQRREFRLFILGTGPLEGKLQARIGELGLTDVVTLLGFRGDAQRYIAHADLMVLASRYEGFPNVVAEALASGTTPAVTDAPGGARELLRDGRYGFLAPSNDPSALADAIVRGLDQPKHTAELQARAAEFRIDRVADRYAELVERALSRPASRGRAASIDLRAKELAG